MSDDRAAVIASIEAGFARTQHPAAASLVGSRDVRDQLQTADPLQHVIGSFGDGDTTVSQPGDPAHPLVRRFGGPAHRP